MAQAIGNIDSVAVTRAEGTSCAVVVCEHAACAIPDAYGDLGLDADARRSHIAWDPGALPVAERLAARLDAVLVAGTVSRLVYDLNRPPEAPDAMPAISETTRIPANAALSQADRLARTARWYDPFEAELATQITRRQAPLLVTIHSFTPVYKGRPRTVDIGVLHGEDARLADAMLACAAAHTGADVQRNEPYGPGDGVLHTLLRHAVPQGHPNVMIEIRNDLIATPEAQTAMGDMLAGWLTDAFAATGLPGDVACSA
ncbi:N-formylglutamate amidohydrolase [Jannaschia sp. M317]|uniref:N-formylglutamate amidohydrolase n=1 Tax=Jannaschia sp. M317 TaxID=2867011 RepID=UPI0021A35AD6|nr:N-formylglutamate amidohydrolase [Jannaschia sp. M317]UWQ16186.1 N-formylglutamate amidohydrolase [Jannaschia sp. M317]